MGTYTTNKNLFMPTVGEQGWGTLVNGNFETIDNFLKPITVSGSTYTFTGNHTGGSISATSISNSGTLTNTGKITGNGGIGTTSLTTSSTIASTGQIVANGGMKLAGGILYIPHNTTGGVMYFSADTGEIVVSYSSSKTHTFTVPASKIRPVATTFTITMQGRTSGADASYTIKQGSTTVKSGTISGETYYTVCSFTVEIGKTYTVTVSTGNKGCRFLLTGTVYL